MVQLVVALKFWCFLKTLSKKVLIDFSAMERTKLILLIEHWKLLCRNCTVMSCNSLFARGHFRWPGLPSTLWVYSFSAKDAGTASPLHPTFTPVEEPQLHVWMASIDRPPALCSTLLHSALCAKGSQWTYGSST